ncbi:MarR family transcriptional regulator [Candidatus Berkiella aquae]|uniref:MarR family transcriptional regulator n=1 Tax=Candidatus Berkiella aquae TaxID=295108 RepID=A0A0Q9YZL0_9GAMM|nr:MarR family transcriptional regulator [Candidatus Berkiella aquae]MCS5711600.1 MarR family transcriptional regulator [Candidatus Berkiella aquae]
MDLLDSIPLAEQALPEEHTSEIKLPNYPKRIFLALRSIMQSMDSHSRKLNKLFDITVPQIVCLYEIFERGAMTISVLAKSIHLTPSTLVGVIDRLEEKKLVTRMRDVADRRAIFIDITDKGRDFVKNVPQLMHNRLYGSLQSLSESEQILIANSLELLVHLLEQPN